MSYEEISVTDLKERLDSGLSGAQLVDVRELSELAASRLEGAVNLPLSQFQVWSGRLEEYLDPTLETLVLCHHGMRSAQMCSYLLQRGFENVKNVSGGIDAYALHADPRVPRY